jgi:RNA polymerase sigma factor (TIGR02999 family)
MVEQHPSDVSRILSRIDDGDPRAAKDLLPLVYQELRKLAGARMSRESPGQTLSATALVHEAWIRLVGDGNTQGPGDTEWNGRAHFFGAAAEAMRRILIERARGKQRLKRGGDRMRVSLDAIEAAAEAVQVADLLSIDEALSRLAQEDAAAAELVKLRFYAGLSIEEAGKVVGISRSTAYEQWSYARAWLRCALDEEGGSGGG